MAPAKELAQGPGPVRTINQLLRPDQADTGGPGSPGIRYQLALAKKPFFFLAFFRFLFSSSSDTLPAGAMGYWPGPEPARTRPGNYPGLYFNHFRGLT